MNDTKTYNRDLAMKAQKELCEQRKFPHFAPTDGICYRCRQDIYKPREYEAMGKTFYSGVSVEKATQYLITGCPHCSHSYCD